LLTLRAKLDASIERADQTIAKVDKTRVQIQASMEKSDEVLAEVEANKGDLIVIKIPENRALKKGRFVR
jgi:septal ring factor EnvC (AmiA/AmiB activator)